MKLFIYDQKHEKIRAELDIQDNQDIISEVIEFLAEKELTNQYNSLIIARSYTVKYEDDGPEIEFQY